MSQHHVRERLPTAAGDTRDGLALLLLARQALAAGRLVAGRALLDAAREAGTPGEALDEIDASLLIDEGKPDAALALLLPAVARSPESCPLRCLAADARLAAGDPGGAVRDAAEAVIDFPREPAPKASLGAALLVLGHLTEAKACLDEALVANPAHVGYRLAMAHALADSGAAPEALAVLDEGIALRPQALALRSTAIRFAVAAGLHPEALARADAARDEGAIDAVILGLRGHALSCLDRDAEAVEAYREALALAPEDVYVRHLVAAAGLIAPPSRACPEYVRVLFNGFARHFEDDLIRLRYRVPGLIRAAVLAHGAAGPVLDLGCGTGLVGVVLSDLPLGSMVGVDLSPAMLKEAAAKQLYERLIEGDVCDPTGWGGPFGLAIGGDVLPYLGDPTLLLAASHSALIPGGLFVLTAETLVAADGQAPPPWQLGIRARYAHDPAGLCAAARRAGFAVVACEPEMLRLDRGRPVDGVLLVLRRLPGAVA